MEVEFEVGPVDAEAARLWIAASQEIIRIVRTNRAALPFSVEVPPLDLADSYLTIWSEVAGHDEPFHWRSPMPLDAIRDIAELWRKITAMTDAELDALGAEWPPSQSDVFFEALLDGVVTALADDPSTSGLAVDLSERPPGTEADDLRGSRDEGDVTGILQRGEAVLHDARRTLHELDALIEQNRKRLDHRHGADPET